MTSISTLVSLSRRMRSFVLVAATLGAGSVGFTPRASAQNLVTGLQANGSECVTYTNDFTLNRNELGLYNTSGSNITVECPIIDASDDSYPSAAPIKRVEVHYRGSAPTCHMEVRAFSGAVSSSPNLTATTSPLSGLPVVRLSSAWTVQPAFGQNASFILVCTVPVDSWIVGMTATREQHRIEGGV